MKILSHYSHENILHIDCIDEVRKTIKISHAELQLWYNSEPIEMRPEVLFPITDETALYIAEYYLPYKPTRGEKLLIKIAYAIAVIGAIAIIYRLFQVSTFIKSLI